MKRSKFVTVEPGKFFDPAKGVSTGAHSKVDTVTCRRVADFGGAMGGTIPPGAGRDRCDMCNAEVVYNPADPIAQAFIDAGATRRCQRCNGIEPLPFPKEK